MVITKLNKLIENRQFLHTMLVIMVLCLIIGILIPRLGYKSGFVIMCGIFYLALSAISLIKYQFGYYASLTFGFLIFIAGRFSEESLPLGLLVELPLWLACIGLFIKRTNNNEIIFAKKTHIITVFFFIFIAYYFLQIGNPNSLSFLAWIYTFRRILMFGLIYFLSIQLFSTIRNIVFFFKYWIGIALVAAIYGCIQQWFGFFEFEYNWLKSSPVRSQLFYIGGGVYRKFSLFSDPASFGIGMATTFVFTLVLMIRTKGGLKKFFLFLISILLMLAVGYSGTRTAYFIIVAGICFYILLTITNRNTLIFASVSFLLFAIILFAPIYSSVTINRFRSTFQFSNDASMNVRNVNREMIRPYIYAHPFGGGLSTSGGSGLKYTPNHILAGFATDSGYVRTAVEAGWIALLLQCIFYFFILNSGVKAYFKCGNKVLRFYLSAALTCLFSFVIAQYGQDATDSTPLCFLFYPCLALISKANYFNKPLINS